MEFLRIGGQVVITLIRPGTRRWVKARLVDSPTANRIVAHEDSHFLRRLRAACGILGFFFVLIGIALFGYGAWVGWREFQGVAAWVYDLLTIGAIVGGVFFTFLRRLKTSGAIWGITALVSGSIAISVYGWFYAISPYRLLVSWLLLGLLSLWLAQEKYKRILFAAVAYVAVDLGLSYAERPWSELNLYSWVTGVIAAVVGSRWLIPKIWGYLALGASLFAFYRKFRILFHRTLIWIGGVRKWALAGLTLTLAVTLARGKIPFIDALLDDSRVLYNVVATGYVAVLLSLIVKERPYFSAAFALGSWILLFFRGGGMGENGIELRFLSFSYQPGMVALAGGAYFFLAFFGRKFIGETPEARIKLSDMTGLGPIGVITLLVIAAVV